jgi:hypothetical protein
VIINIEPGTFGGRLRMGDLVGVCNVVEYIRKSNNNNTIRFNVKLDGISEDGYCRSFYFFLMEQTNYFTTDEGRESLPWRNVNLWDFRDISGDLVKIPNTHEMKKKIVIFPLFDAPYNTYRNWPNYIFEDLIKQYNREEYKDYEKVICSKIKYNIDGWHSSDSIIANLIHIMEAEIFIGGDTGTTHFAFALDRSPKTMLYYNSSRALVHTLPFYLMEGKGKMTSYWLDFEGTKWR